MNGTFAHSDTSTSLTRDVSINVGRFRGYPPTGRDIATLPVKCAKLQSLASN